MKSTIPENQARFTLNEVRTVTGGTLQGAGETIVEGVATDSRSAVRGKLFIALSGPRFDGHTFATAALRGGARALLVEGDVGDVGLPVLRVPSTRAALCALGAYHRQRWGGQLAAVAGSAGKTTTRGAISVALEAAAPGSVHACAGNLNNAIGVPMVLLGLSATHRFAVVEIGTNAPGEVRELTELSQPNVAVLTLIGLEHTELLGDLDGVEAEEGSLFQASGVRCTAIGNGDDPRVARQLLKAATQSQVRYGFGAGLEYQILERTVGELGPARVHLARPGREVLRVSCPLLGRPGATALAAGVATAEALAETTLTAEALSEAFARSFVPEPGRLVAVPLANGAVVLDDSYNSNPASLQSSVAAAAELAEARGGRLVLVLGEMRELGEASPELHRAAGQELARFPAALVIAVGGDARWLLEPFERGEVRSEFAADAEAASKMLAGELLAGDVVLVKASRGVRAERVIEALIRAYRRRA